MSRAAIALSVLIAGLAAMALGYGWGRSAGRAQQQAASDVHAVQQLTDALAAHADLTKRSTEASRAMRLAAARLGTLNAKTTKEMTDVLQATADSRVGCVFPAGIMRGLGDARDRAAAAATHGIIDTVPAAASGASPER